MGDINWDLAPEGAERLVQCGWFIGWVKEGHVWCNYTCVWEQDHTLNDEETIATRPQEPREEYEKARGEKVGEWTHLDPDGRKCIIIHVHDSVAWVRYENRLSNELWDADSLKPIKPKLTKAEAWDMLNEKASTVNELGVRLLELHGKYEIID